MEELIQQDKWMYPQKAVFHRSKHLFIEYTSSIKFRYLARTVDRNTLEKFIEWLCKHEPVHGHIMDGYWWHMGTVDQHHKVNQTVQIEVLLPASSVCSSSPVIREFEALLS